MSLIVDHLYLSAVQTSRNHKFFKTQKITHVLIAARKLKMIFKEVNYKKLQLDDNPNQNIAKYFSESIQFIHEAISEKQNVLVHCLGGKSRSVTVVIAYVMLTLRMPFEKAFEFVKLQHKHANPNPGFISQLKVFEKCIDEYFKQAPREIKGGFDFKLLAKIIREKMDPGASEKQIEVEKEKLQEKIEVIEIIDELENEKGVSTDGGIIIVD